MKSLNSKLFDSKSINDSLKEIVGGGNNYTSTGSDSAMNSSGQYDTINMTYDKNGKNGTMDTHQTGSSTEDKPL